MEGRPVARRSRPMDVLGVPLLPPAGITRITTRLRAALASVHRSMAPPPLGVLESLFGLLDHAALVALCALDVPDSLDQAMTIGALASRVEAEEAALDRVVRYAVARGWLRLDRRGRVAPTRTSRFLRRDHPGGWRAWVELMGGTDVVGASGALTEAVRTGGQPFAMANGASFFDWMTEHPARGAAFDAAMAAGARMHGLALAAAVDWSDARRVCDVGGGDGALLEVLVGAQRHLSGVLLDLPDVVARAEPRRRAAIDVVGGDAFEAVPADADTYLLVNVVHDWSDADAVRLLTRIATDARSGARIIVVEGRRRQQPIDDVAHRTDLLMFLLAPGGRERSEEEMRSLAVASGLMAHAVVPLASGDVAYIFGREGSSR